MNDIDKYMIPLDNIRSVGSSGVAMGILFALILGLATALVAALVASICLEHDKDIMAVAVTVGIIGIAVAGYCLVRSGDLKSIDIPKVNDEYGITVTSMDDEGTEQGGIGSHRLSYLHDGAIINGTLISKDDKVGLFAGTGDKLTPVKPR